MVTFIFIRHGCTQFNIEKRYTGQMDIPLNSLGVWQAERTAEYLIKNFTIDAIYSSDLSRAINTVKPIADVLGLPIQPNKDLREVYLGNWQGRLIEEVKTEYVEWVLGYTQTDDKESRDTLQKRSLDVIQKIALENEGKSVLVSTHGGVLNALLRNWFGESSDIDRKMPGNASISVVNYDSQLKSADVLMLGYSGYLSYGSFEK